nr:OmpW family outer membrane protein [Donghicola eburneus]
MGDVTYGAPNLTLRYHFNTESRLSPYIGAGAIYALILDEEDGALSDVSVSGAWGAVIVAGVDYAIEDRWAAFAEVKKSWVETETRFSAPTPGGPVPGTSTLTIDPTTVSVGISYRF